METVPINTIITHVNPDLDGMLSILLLRKYGESLFPGVSSARIDFIDATDLPYGMAPSQLEKKGMLAVDIGGGRFDSHPVKNGVAMKADRAAADLVAEKLGLIHDEKWKSFIEYTRLHDTIAHGLYSSEPLHHIFSLNSALEGITLRHEDDSGTILEKGIRLISVIPSYVDNSEKDLNKEVMTRIISGFFAVNGIDPDGAEEENEHFRQWYSQMKTDPDLTFGKHPLDRLVALRSLLQGAFYHFDQNETLLQDYAILLFEAILARERQWYTAVKQYREEATVKKIGDLRFATISSQNGLVIKASRFVDNPDILIYHNPVNSAVTVFIQRRGKLNKYPFENIAARIRLSEALENKEKIEFDNLASLGTFHGWFLHQSRNLLIRGSRKKIDFIPTSIPLSKLTEIIYMEFDQDGEYEMNPKFIEAWLKFKNPFFRKQNDI